jgi:hypothetical protein
VRFLQLNQQRISSAGWFRRQKHELREMRLVVPSTQRKALWQGLAVMAVAAVAALGLGASNGSPATAQARTRTVIDMPDDISGPQVHFLYIVPSDGADAQLDTKGGMEQSIARIERCS